MAAAAAPPHLAGHHCITITPLSATHQQRQHHRNNTVPSPFTLCTIVPAPFPTTASSRSTIFSPPHLQRASTTPPQLRRANLRSAHVFYHHRSSVAPPSRRHFLLPVSVHPLHAQLPSSPLHLQRARHHHLHTRTAAMPPPRIAHSHDNLQLRHLELSGFGRYRLHHISHSFFHFLSFISSCIPSRPWRAKLLGLIPL